MTTDFVCLSFLLIFHRIGSIIDNNRFLFHGATVRAMFMLTSPLLKSCIFSQFLIKFFVMKKYYKVKISHFRKKDEINNLNYHNL